MADVDMFCVWFGHQSRSNHYPKVATPLVIFVNRRLARYGAPVNTPRRRALKIIYIFKFLKYIFEFTKGAFSQLFLT